jgi:hypothetical protein
LLHLTSQDCLKNSTGVGRGKLTSSEAAALGWLSSNRLSKDMEAGYGWKANLGKGVYFIWKSLSGRAKKRRLGWGYKGSGDLLLKNPDHPIFEKGLTWVVEIWYNTVLHEYRH